MMHSYGLMMGGGSLLWSLLVLGLVLLVWLWVVKLAREVFKKK